MRAAGCPPLACSDQNQSTDLQFQYSDGSFIFANYIGGTTFAVFNSDGTISMVDITGATAAWGLCQGYNTLTGH